MVVAYDATVQSLAEQLGLTVCASIRQPAVSRALASSDVLVCVHGREIVPADLLALPRFGGLNVHPCLSAYPGADPIGRLLQDGNPRASVGVHRMTEQIDTGEVLVEEFIDVSGRKSREDVYNALYPVYVVVLVRALAQVSLSGAVR